MNQLKKNATQKAAKGSSARLKSGGAPACAGKGKRTTHCRRQDCLTDIWENISLYLWWQLCELITTKREKTKITLGPTAESAGNGQTRFVLLLSTQFFFCTSAGQNVIPLNTAAVLDDGFWSHIHDQAETWKPRLQSICSITIISGEIPNFAQKKAKIAIFSSFVSAEISEV